MNKRRRKKENYNEEKIWRVMRDYYTGKVNYTSTLKRLKNLELTLVQIWKQRAKEEEDYRTGEEVYGYEDNQKQFNYISDRWNCAYRLAWIIGLLELRRKVNEQI